MNKERYPDVDTGAHTQCMHDEGVKGGYKSSWSGLLHFRYCMTRRVEIVAIKAIL